MTTVRRVMTAQTPTGKSVFGNVQEVEPDHAGVLLHRVWGWDEPPALPFAAPSDFPALSVFPSLGGVRVNVSEFPPGFGRSHPSGDAADTEAFEHMSGTSCDVEFVDADPGFHATDTVDIGIVISGEVCLQLDSGEERVLRAGDVLLQMGTIHAWHNPASEPCLMALVVLGLARDSRAASESIHKPAIAPE